MNTGVKVTLIICVGIIAMAALYAYRGPLKALATVGGIGLLGYIAAGGTIAGYKLYQKYQAAKIIKPTATIEAEAAAGAVDINTAGQAVTAGGEVITAGEVATGAATLETGAAAGAIGEAVTATEILEGAGLILAL